MLRIWSPILTAVLHLFLYIRSSNTEKGVERTMKRPLYRLGVMLLALVLVLALPVTSFAATAATWDTSKSKTATNLDSNYISNVTLSLPSAQETLVTDVVFVLDESSCSDPVKDSVKEMLSTLYNRIQNTGATVKVGAVQFRGEVTKLDLTELNENTIDNIKEFMGQRASVGGSNMSAGLIAGKAMLDADSTVSEDRKYLILVSDGITYIWDDETTAAQENYGVNFANSDTPNTPMLANPDSWDVKHGNGYVPADWNSWLTETTSLVDKTIAEKASVYERGVDISGNKFVSTSEMDLYACSVDIALYKSYKVFKSIKDMYSHTYVVMAGVESEISQFPFGPSFMNFLADGNTVSFDEIEKKIYYLLDRDSYVEDYMGYTEEYNFDFVNNENNISLKVGGTEYNVIRRTEDLPEGETSHYYFINPNNTQTEGINPDFELIYVKGNGAEEEHFTWNIKVPVSNFAPVQLTYSVQLINPKTEPDTYGTYDADGSKGYPELYTNNSATLYPIDTNGDEGDSEDFNKPTVSYTISGPETQTPVPTYPVYYPDYSEEPAATPTPTPFVPSDETSPKTGAGDAALPALLIVALAAAGVAVVSMRKRAR